MKAAAFEYRRPESLDQALSDLAEIQDRGRPLAGGQSLIPMMALRLAQPEVLVDLGRVRELRGSELSGAELVIKAMTTEAELERCGALPPILERAIARIGHFQIRSRATVGGSLAHMDPAAEWPALALLLDATLNLTSARGRRAVPAADFILGPLWTCLEPDELLESIRLSRPRGGFGFQEVERRAGDFALVGAACQGRAVVVFGAGPRPQRLARVEAWLAGGAESGPELIQLAEAEIVASGDLHASADYRRHVGARLVERVVAAARAGGVDPAGGGN